MRFPAIAKKAFDKLIGIKEYRSLFNKTYKLLKRYNSPIKRARKFHKLIDESISDLFKTKKETEHLSCKKGCTFCCHTQVSVNSDEATLLASIVIEKQLPIDLNKLNLQSNFDQTSTSWYQLSHNDRKCIFLNDEGLCSVYDNRPIVCRTNYTFSKPENCSTETGIEQKQVLLTTDKANIITIASYHASKSSGPLPSMLLKEVKFQLEQKELSKNESLNKEFLDLD